MTASARSWIDCYAGPLSSGDSMLQPEFHRLYERCGEYVHAQLIDGTVFVREPVGAYHAKYESTMDTILGIYETATPGVESLGGASVIMGPRDEVRPDGLLRILPECGGQSCDTLWDDLDKGKIYYIGGAPELIVEVAHSTKSIDLNLKKERYQQAGVIEYVVVCLDPAEFHWYHLRRGRKIRGDSNSIHRSIAFPGLWIHADALMHKDRQTLMSTLNDGLASPEHAKFAKKLKAPRK